MTVSDRAFAALRREKREGESDSQVILRLIQEARRARRDPLGFVGHGLRRHMTAEAHKAMLRADRAHEVGRGR